MATPFIINTTVLPTYKYFIQETFDGSVIYLVTPNKPTIKVFNNLDLTNSQIDYLFDRFWEAEKVAARENIPIQLSVIIK